MGQPLHNPFPFVHNSTAMLTPLFLSFIFLLLLFPSTSSLPQSSRICIKSGPLKSNPPELPTSDHNRAYDRDDNDIDDNINIKIIQTCRGGHATDIINSGKLKGGDIEVRCSRWPAIVARGCKQIKL